MYEGKKLKKIWPLVACFVILCLVVSLVFLGNDSFATTSDEVVETNLFGNFTDDGQGCGVYKILNLVIDILSMGVAIVGIIGVTIVGIQYLTAKDSEEKTRKAKNRMLEIVIGLVAYAVLFAAVQWLLPGGMMNKNCTTVTDEQLAQMKAKEKEKEQEKQKKEEEKKNDKKETKTKEETKKEKKETLQKEKAVKKCKERAAKVVRNDICNLDTGAEKIAETAKLLAWPYGTSSSTYNNRATVKFNYALNQTHFNGNSPGDDCSKYGKSCAAFVDVVVLASGVDPSFPGGEKSKYSYSTAGIYSHLVNSPKWKDIKKLDNKVRPGDIAVKPITKTRKVGHVVTYIKNSSGKTVTAEASLCGFYGVARNTKLYTNDSNYTIFRYVGD